MELIAEFPAIDYVIIKRPTKYMPWIAAWKLELYKGEYVWGQGHYFDDLESCVSYVENLEKEAC
jgi:hypothetical protein